MLTEKDLTDSQETEKANGESFLRGVTDFLKWTSTVAAAAVIWIGGLSGSLTGAPRILAAVSLAAILVSLIVAVITMRRVLTAWAKSWNLAIKDSKYVLLKKLQAVDPAMVAKNQVAEAIDELLDAVDASRTYSRPAEYARWATWHVSLLVLGLILHVIAVVKPRLVSSPISAAPVRGPGNPTPVKAPRITGHQEWLALVVRRPQLALLCCVERRESLM